MSHVCDLCGQQLVTVSGDPGGNNDCLMVNDYITMTDWYKNHRPSSFQVKGPNPYGCRRCIRLLADAGLEGFIGGDADTFLAVDRWWDDRGLIVARRKK